MKNHQNAGVFKVFIGCDSREMEAYRVAEKTLRERSSVPLSITALKRTQLELQGLCRREITHVSKGRSMVIDGNGNGVSRRIVAAAGVSVDVISNAPMSTEFAITRFLTPLLAQQGWALFIDCDVVFLADVAELFALADPHYPLMCVQHADLPTEGVKMDGQPQIAYKRKNWSSVMLFNCDHPANLALTHELINEVPGRDLHRFCWLDEWTIGALPPEWNWLVGVQARPQAPKLAHFTLGGPWLKGWSEKPHDDLWISASRGDAPGR